jgi:hypothetical protein
LTSYKTNPVKNNPVKNNRVRLLTLRGRPKITLPSHFGTLQNNAYGEKKMDWAKMKPEPSKQNLPLTFWISKTPQTAKKKRTKENRDRFSRKNNPRNSWCLSKKNGPAIKYGLSGEKKVNPVHNNRNRYEGPRHYSLTRQFVWCARCSVGAKGIF